ncbi:MAG: YHS domain-containing (seleno)protein, partial [Reinekea sp.]|nr:YHS domain-containing (seleno)protein [Reinekea sp.]
VVSYFADGKAMRGSDEFQYEWRGMRFYFKTQANLAMFVSEPSRYIPQFNGHCANGLSDGHLVRANPEIFRIIDGKLYLFFSWWGKAQWKFDQQEQIELANKFWLEFSQ